MKRVARFWTLAFIGLCLSSPSMATTNNSKSKIKPVVQTVIPHLTQDQDWSLLLPTDKQIAFHGVVSYDKAGGSTNSMLYPAPNAAGLLAALLTHAIINESVHNSEKSKIQKAADTVVEPYTSSLANYSYAQLFSNGLPKVNGIKIPILVAPGNKPATQWVAESLPAYFMTPGGDAIWIENILVLYDAGAKKKESYPMTVKVLSRDRVNFSERPNYWQEENGKQLKVTFESLLAESVELARQELTQTLAMEDVQFETVRYFEGSNERMERGKVLQRNCDRVILKTLRGWIMSVPRIVHTNEDSSSDDKISNDCPSQTEAATSVNPATTGAKTSDAPTASP